MATLKSVRAHGFEEDSVFQCAQKLCGEYVGGFGEQLSICESPIEKMLLMHLLHKVSLIETHRDHFYFDIDNIYVMFSPRVSILSGKFRIDIAAEVEYRLPGEPQDKDPRTMKFAIECDGFEFHSSKEQMQNDYQRERDIQIYGCHVIRFTGSEIFADPAKCAEEVFKIISTYLLNLYTKG